MTSTDTLIDYAMGLKYEDLPGETIEDIKIHILDTVGAAIAGSISEGSQNMVRLLEQWGGRAESTIFVYGHKLPSANAALLNSMMARGFDFETILSGGATHVSASVIPAAFAIAEYSDRVKKRPVTGQELITAIVIGTDLNWRFRVAGGRRTIMAGGWLAETFSPPAIALLGGKLLGFEKERVNYAMGIGYGQCCGTYGATVGHNGGMMAQLSQGFGAKAGVLSVLIAEAGFTSYKDVIDGPWGLYSMYGDGTYDRDILIGELGIRYSALKPGIKRFPGCGATQPVISSVLALMNENNLGIKDIAEVKIKVGDSSYKLCGQDKYEPLNPADALWNYRYSAAVAIAKGKVFIDDFSEKAIREPLILELISRIKVEPDKSFGHKVEVQIETIDGRSFRTAMDDMESVSRNEIIEKFVKCCSFSARPFPREKAEQFIESVEKLEEIENACEFISELKTPFFGRGQSR